MSGQSSWVSPKTQKGLVSKTIGKGFFAVAPINKGEALAIKGGALMDKKTLYSKGAAVIHACLQIADDVFIAPNSDDAIPGSMIYNNHSCEPNIGIQGQVVFVAMRDIVAGEELTLDYATVDYTDELDPGFVCNCGSKSCRGKILTTDWQLPELQDKYQGYFSWFLQRKIAEQGALRAERV